nr:hypothetical protein [Tanacetum cinerariifolium]
MMSSSCGESGVKNADLVSFKNSDKSSSFIFFEISSALDSLFVPESVWAAFNLSLADLLLYLHSESASGHDALVDFTVEAGSNLSVLVDKTKSARDRLKAAHTDSGTNKESRADDISKKIKLDDLSEFLKDTRSAFFTPDSPQDEPIIVIDESEEEDANEEETHDTSHDMLEDTSVLHPPSPKSAQIQELMAQVQLLKSQKDELEQEKATAKLKLPY